MMWPDCSPPSARARAQKLFEHVLVAHVRPQKLYPARAQRQLKPDVAHHRGDDAVALQLAALLHALGQRPERGVAVHELPAPVHEERAVGVAVEGDAEVRALLDDARAQNVRVERAAVAVDVAPVGRVEGRDDARAEPPEQRRREFGGRAVGAVRDDGQPFETQARRDLSAQVVEVERAQLGRTRPRLRRPFPITFSATLIRLRGRRAVTPLSNSA